MAEDAIAFLEAIVGRPARLVGCSAGASVALLVALRRPDLARRVVLISGVFHRDGWVPGAIDPDASPPEVLARGYAELSHDGPHHFAVVNAKVARMNWEEPALAVVPGTSHGHLHEKPTLCNTIIVDFLTSDPVPTIAPVRGASVAWMRSGELGDRPA